MLRRCLDASCSSVAIDLEVGSRRATVVPVNRMTHEDVPSDVMATFADVSVPVEVQIGESLMSLAEILKLNAGSIMRLDRPAGETLDLFIGNVRLASVEVVVTEDQLAVRITEFDR